MLTDKTGKHVQVSDKLNSQTHSKIFANLREIHEPDPKFVGKMFNLEQRAKITNLR